MSHKLLLFSLMLFSLLFYNCDDGIKIDPVAFEKAQNERKARELSETDTIFTPTEVRFSEPKIQKHDKDGECGAGVDVTFKIFFKLGEEKIYDTELHAWDCERWNDNKQGTNLLKTHKQLSSIDPASFQVTLGRKGQIQVKNVRVVDDWRYRGGQTGSVKKKSGAKTSKPASQQAVRLGFQVK